MFGSNGKARGPGPVDTLIGGGVVLRGELRFSGGLYVDGQVVGQVRGDEGVEAMLTVSEQGRIEGEVHAPVVVINGEVQGDVHAHRRLELGPKARIHGNLHYRVLVMAAGAAVNGHLVHSSGEAPSASPGTAA